MARRGFNSDTAALRRWINSRKTSMEKTRAPIESIWRDIRDYYEPSIGKALDNQSPDNAIAERGDEKILNTRPRILLHRMAAGLQSGITNQARKWFQLKTVDNKVAERAAVRGWLADTSDKVYSLLNRSNAYPALDQIYLHLGAYGTACAIVSPSEEQSVHVVVCDEGAYYIAENRLNRVDQLLHKIEMPLGQIAEEFGLGWLPDNMQEQFNKGDHGYRYTVLNYIGPRNDKVDGSLSDEFPFMSIYMLEGDQSDSNNGILDIRGYMYNPILAPRWAVIGSPYGTGCGYIGLPDAKQIQKLEEDKLKLVAEITDPPLAVPASMKGEPIDTGPGGINYVPDAGMHGSDNTMRPLIPIAQQLDAIVHSIQEVDGRLAQVFYADLFSMMINLNMQPKQMTAREVNELSGEKVALLGPILTRLNIDLLDPLVDALFSLVLQMQLVESAPEELAGQELKVEYVSSLHLEQASTATFTSMYRILEFAGAVAQIQPEVLDKIDGDKMIDKAAQSAEDFGIVRDQDEVDAMRQARAEQQAQQQQAAMMAQTAPGMARAAKDLSQTPMGTGNALEAALAAGGMEQ